MPLSHAYLYEGSMITNGISAATQYFEIKISHK